MSTTEISIFTYFNHILKVKCVTNDTGIPAYVVTSIKNIRVFSVTWKLWIAVARHKFK